MSSWGGVGQLTEVPAEPDLSRVVQLLVPEEDHLVPVQGIGEPRDGGLIQRAGKVDAVNVGADVAGDRADGQFSALSSDSHQGSPF